MPTLWVSSWYDLSTAPNLEIVNHIRSTASAEVADAQYVVVAPTQHCAMYRLRDPLIVGERDMGNVDFGFDSLLWSFLDAYVKAADNGFADTEPKLRYFAMGANEWRSDSQWPPTGVETRTLFLASQDGANSLNGDGTLSPSEDAGRRAFDEFRYDPLNPVPSLGGNLWGSLAGSFDNRAIEARDDVLVYTTDVLEEDLDVSGTIDVLLYVSSDAPDTDFTVKLLDVYPDGRAMNIDETILRARYREGFDREVSMRPGEVVELRLPTMTTSNVFLAGHRLRIEVSSSNFPRFQRNLNTGGDNYTESSPRTALNRVHHSREHASRLVLSVRK